MFKWMGFLIGVVAVWNVTATSADGAVYEADARLVRDAFWIVIIGARETLEADRYQNPRRSGGSLGRTGRPATIPDP